MNYVVYLDVIFFQNFIMDFFCLWFMLLIMKEKISYVRLGGISVVGSVIGVLWTVVCHNFAMYSCVILFVLNPCMVLAASKWKGFLSFLKGEVCFHIGYVLMGGFLQIAQTIVGLPGLNWNWILGGGILLLILGRSVIFLLKQQSELINVVLLNQEHRISCTGLWDSGNLLVDPYEQKGVSIVPASFQEQLGVKKEQIRYVPYTTIEGNHALLEVATITGMKVSVGKKEMIIKKTVVGFAKEQVFLHKRYQVILQKDYEREGYLS